MQLGILASGNLGFRTIYSLYGKGILLSCLFTDKGSEAIISFARENNIPLYIGNPRRLQAIAFLKDLQPIDLLISVNYLFLLNDVIISYPTNGCVNIHGSLLPKYRGRTPHVWAIINNEKATGITVHYIDKECDTGDIILQENMSIENNFTGADILKQFEARYPELVLTTIELFKNGKPIGTPQIADFATYFGKRSPADGKINWDWQKERIYNWVRAQADPYPGAFTMYEDSKIIIDEILFTEMGFSSEMPNGLILQSGERPLVKTSNGAIILNKLRSNIRIEKGKIFK